jgi:DNA polymerase I-like protein with 3'-5' exonuclease and polymerase domains
MTQKILVIDKNPNKTDYSKVFGFEVETKYLCNEKVARVLKSNLTLDLDIIFDYDFVILIGADALKIFSNSTSITEATGRRVGLKKSKYFENKEHDGLIACVNPMMTHFKPEMKPITEQSIESIQNIIKGLVTEKIPTNYKLIDTEEKAKEYLNFLIEMPPKLLALDSETSALYPRDGYVLGISITHEMAQGVYILSDCLTENILKDFQELIINNSSIHLVLHNAKFDLKFFKFHFGWDFNKAFIENRLHDTMLEHYILDERAGTHGLKSLAIKYTDLGDYELPLEEFKKEYCKINKIKLEDFTYDLIPIDIIWKYAACDTDVCYRLHNYFYPLIESNAKLKSLYYDVMLPSLEFLTRMEDRGVPVAISRLQSAKSFLYKKLERLNTELRSRQEIKVFEDKMGKEFNPNSPIQLRTLLFDIAGITPLDVFTSTGQLSTDADVLEKLSEKHPLPKLLLEIRKTLKILNTYIIKMIDNIDKDGRLRTGFNQHTTTSGRLSSSGKLNLQQLPRDDAMVKGCIVAPKGYRVVACDLTTAEMWVAASLSGDKALQEVFINMAKDGKNAVDFHSSIAHLVFQPDCLATEVKKLYPALRQASKAINK